MEKLSTDQKLDLLIGEVAKIQKQTAEIPVLVAKISALEDTVKAQDAVIAALQKDVLHLKNICNDREQLDRNNTLRLFNFPSSGSEVGLANRVYDKILKPILAAAKNSGQIARSPMLPIFSHSKIITFVKCKRCCCGSSCRCCRLCCACPSLCLSLTTLVTSPVSLYLLEVN